MRFSAKQRIFVCENFHCPEIILYLVVLELELRNSGGAGEYQGYRLGVYNWYQTITSEDGIESNVYKQRNDVNVEKENFMYRSMSKYLSYLVIFFSFRQGQYWYASAKNIERLRAPAGVNKFPPSKGWEYWNDTNGWMADPTMKCGPPKPACKAVNVEISGKYFIGVSIIYYNGVLGVIVFLLTTVFETLFSSFGLLQEKQRVNSHLLADMLL